MCLYVEGPCGRFCVTTRRGINVLFYERALMCVCIERYLSVYLCASEVYFSGFLKYGMSAQLCVVVK